MKIYEILIENTEPEIEPEPEIELDPASSPTIPVNNPKLKKVRKKPPLRGPVDAWPPEQDADDFQAPDRKDLDFKAVTDRIPQLTDASDKLAAGEIDRYEYQRLVNKYKPVSSYTELPVSADDDTIKANLRTDSGDPNKLDKVGAKLPNGTPVELRLDIPAYKDSGTWVVAVHRPSVGSPYAYRSTAIANDVSFRIRENTAHNIARNMHPKTGTVVDKSPIATVKGTWEEATPEEARAQATTALAASLSPSDPENPQWIQIGMDPERHSYFYDRKTTKIGNHMIHRPVESGSKVIQIGSILFLKDPVYGDFDEKMYEISLSEALKQIDMEIFNELTFHGRQCTDQCQGHMAGWQWEKKRIQAAKKLNPDAAGSRQQTPSNSFNNGTEIAANQAASGINPISTGIKGDKGRFVKYTGPDRYPKN